MITPFGLLGINRLGQRLCLGKQAEARAPQPFIIRRREGCQERESGNVAIFQTLLMSRFCNSSSFGNVARLPTLPPVAIFLSRRCQPSFLRYASVSLTADYASLTYCSVSYSSLPGGPMGSAWET